MNLAEEGARVLELGIVTNMDNKTSAKTGPALKLRMTRQRLVILQGLQVHGSHPAADEVYTLVRKKLPKISLGTVYRNLDILSRGGLIKRISLGDGQSHYDGRIDQHYHIRCVECGKISDVSADEFGDLDAAAKSACEFEILNHQLQFEGVCKNCKNVRHVKFEEPVGTPAANNERLM